MQPVDRLSLHPHQQALLAEIVAAYDQDHSEFRVHDRTRIRHKALEQSIRVHEGDLVALQRAGMIDVVTTDSADWVSAFAPTALSSMSVRPSDYLDLSDAAWAVAKDTLHNEPERIRDAQRILRRIADDADAPDGIRETARAADTLLGQVERYVDSGNLADEPLARSSAAGLRALAATILRQTGAYGPLAIELAEKVAGLFDT